MAKDHGNQDLANNMPRWASTKNFVDINNANRTTMFGNTTPGVWGVFAVNATKARASHRNAGIIARLVGTGRRAGRVMYETLVAGGTYGKGADANPGVFPNATVTIVLGTPANVAVTAPAPASFTVGATFRPAGANGAATYLWEQSINSGTSWTTVTNATVFTGATTATLSISNTTGLNTYLYRCTVVASVGATPKVSRAALLNS